MGWSRVLLVDDEYLVRYSIEKALEQQGLAVDTAASAEEALSQLETVPYDLCFLDLRLPGMGGLDAIKAIKSRQPSIKVLVITASSLSREESAILESYAAGLIEKPFDLRRVVALAEQQLGRA